MPMLGHSMQSGKRVASPAMWFVAALLGVIAACLVIEAGVSVASGDGDEVVTPASRETAHSGSLLAVTGKISRDQYGLYLLDLESRTICVYQWLSNSRKLRLVAARNYTYDRQLDNYNTEPPPREIRDLVEKARRLEQNNTPR